MKILIVGGGGREHALAWKCAHSPRVHQVFVEGSTEDDRASDIDFAKYVEAEAIGELDVRKYQVGLGVGIEPGQGLFH